MQVMATGSTERLDAEFENEHDEVANERGRALIDHLANELELIVGLTSV